jgi:hypothetical protein
LDQEAGVGFRRAAASGGKAVENVLFAKPAVTLQFSLLLSLSTIMGNMPVKLKM